MKILAIIGVVLVLLVGILFILLFTIVKVADLIEWTREKWTKENKCRAEWVQDRLDVVFDFALVIITIWGALGALYLVSR